MLVRERGRPTYLLSSNPQIRLWHCRLGYASNARVIQVSKLVDKIDLEGAAIQKDESYLNSSDFKTDDEDIKQSDTDADNEPASINKMTNNINGIEQLCETCIKSKHTRIVKSKKMTSITKRLQEVHTDL